jgi:hypothetical protein
MSESITLDGVTFTTAAMEGADGFGFKESVTVGGASYWRLFALFAAAMRDLGKALTTTSATSHDISTGTKIFTLDAEIPLAVGARMQFWQVSNTANRLHAEVTARSATTLTVSVSDTEGSGSGITDWACQIAGQQGAAGTLSGNAGGAIDMAGYDLEIDLATVNQIGKVLHPATVSVTTTQTIDTATAPMAEFELAAAAPLFSFTAPPAGYDYGGMMILKQDSTGARVPAFNLAGASPDDVFNVTSEPSWSSQTADTATQVTYWYDGRNGRLYLRFDANLTGI